MFPSDEWIDDFCALLRAHPGAPAMAGALAGVYRFVVEPAGALQERHVYDVTVAPADDPGGVPTVAASPRQTAQGTGSEAEPAGAGQPRLTVRAGYDRWVQLLRGQLDLPMAVLLRRVRVSGDLGALTGRLDDARPLVDALHGVDSTFLP